jgi:DNA invertase Pin-like site-specific DNA recombinase
MKKIIGFVRTSTMKQANSIKNQRDRIKEYANGRDMKLVDIIEEEGISGNALKRLGFDIILQMVENKQIDAVVCYWLSRAGRNASKVIELINKCLEKNVALISIKEGIDTSTAGGRIQAKLMAVIAEEELILIKERIKAVIKHKKERGLQYNGTPAYGTYVKNGLIYADEYELGVVRNMKNQRSRGWSWYKIMKALNNKKIPTKMNGANGWTINQVKKAFIYHYGEAKAVQLIK